MTSSWSLAQRKKMGNVWNIKNFGESSLDHHIINGAHRECSPGYLNTPIGNQYGFSVCSKIIRPDGKDLNAPLPLNGEIADYNGYNKYRVDLYSGPDVLPTQLSNPYGFYDRKVPNESFLHQYDYLTREIKYNGIGVKPLRTPQTGFSPRLEYGFSFDNAPPYKYDIQRLEQPYPIFKAEMINKGYSQESMDAFDKQYTNRNSMGTW